MAPMIKLMINFIILNHRLNYLPMIISLNLIAFIIINQNFNLINYLNLHFNFISYLTIMKIILFYFYFLFFISLFIFLKVLDFCFKF
jgi:hypothetical protein